MLSLLRKMADTSTNAKHLTDLLRKSSNIIVGSCLNRASANTIARIQTPTGEITATALNDIPPGQAIVFKADTGAWYCTAVDSKNTGVKSETIIYKRKLSPDPQVKPGPVKVLFYIHEGGRIVFYIGGDRPNPTRIYDIPVRMTSENGDSYYPNIYGFVNNTGKGFNDWIVSLKYHYHVLQWDGKYDINSGDPRFNSDESGRYFNNNFTRRNFGVPIESPSFLTKYSTRVSKAGPTPNGYSSYDDPKVIEKFSRIFAVTITPDETWTIEGEKAAAVMPVAYGFWTAVNDVVTPVLVNNSNFPPGFSEIYSDFSDRTVNLKSVFPTFCRGDLALTRSNFVSTIAGRFDGAIVGSGETAAISCYKSTSLQIQKGSWSIAYSLIRKIREDESAFLPSVITAEASKVSKIAIFPGKFVDGFSYSYKYKEGEEGKVSPFNGFTLQRNLLWVNNTFTKAIVRRLDKSDFVRGTGIGQAILSDENIWVRQNDIRGQVYTKPVLDAGVYKGDNVGIFGILSFFTGKTSNDFGPIDYGQGIAPNPTFEITSKLELYTKTPTGEVATTPDTLQNNTSFFGLYSTNFERLDRLEVYRRYTSFVDSKLYFVDFLTSNTHVGFNLALSAFQPYPDWSPRVSPVGQGDGYDPAALASFSIWEPTKQYKEGDRIAWVAKRTIDVNRPEFISERTVAIVKKKRHQFYNINSSTGVAEVASESEQASNLSFKWTNTDGILITTTQDCAQTTLEKVAYECIKSHIGANPATDIGQYWRKLPLADITKEAADVRICQYEILGNQIKEIPPVTVKVYPLTNLTPDKAIVMSDWIRQTFLQPQFYDTRADGFHFIISASYYPQ